MRLTAEQHRDFATIYEYLRIESGLPESADAIVVGGAGTRTDMADRAAEIYLKGTAPLVVFSGFAHPDFDVNEAELLKSRAIELGVPEEAIVTETKATNTGLNIILSAKKLSQQSTGCSRVVLVHRPFMTRRFLATAEAQWPQPKPEFFVTSANYKFDDYLKLNADDGLGPRMLLSMLKDYASFKTYPKLGYMSTQPFDSLAETAYLRLVEAGFVPPEASQSLATDRFTS